MKIYVLRKWKKTLIMSKRSNAYDAFHAIDGRQFNINPFYTSKNFCCTDPLQYIPCNECFPPLATKMCASA